MKTFFSVLLLFVLQSSQSQTLDWTSLPQEISGASYCRINDMVVYNGKLVVCGTFTMAGSTPVQNIAAWDGSQWTSLGRGLRPPNAGSIAHVNKMLVFNNELYAVGLFDTAGTVAAPNIAKWNGTTWSGFTTYVTGQINTIAAFNNEIYVGGSFWMIESLNTKYMAKYDGSSWQALGAGLGGGVGVNELCVFNNGLYVSGSFMGAGSVLADNIAKWDGSAWHTLNTSNSPGYAMGVWNGKLLHANHMNGVPGATDINQWDGANWSVFSHLNFTYTAKFYIYNNKLYSGAGQNSPTLPGDSWVYVWDPGSQVWSKVGTGINYNVFALCEYNGELYCAGRFNKNKNAGHNYIAKLAPVTGLHKNMFEDAAVKFFPNPVSDKLSIEFAGNINSDLNITLTNAMGQTVLSGKTQILNSKCDVDMAFLKSGVYYLKIQNEEGSKVFKIVKE